MRKLLLSLGLVAAASMPSVADDKPVGDPYPLGKCPVSGKALTADAVSVVKDGREVKLCCAGCEGKVDAAVLGKADAAIIEQQKAAYPLNTCIMAGQKLGDKAVDAVIGNRLIRFCCSDCADNFKKDVAGNMKKLDAAIIEKQKASYTLKTCPVSGEELGSMGDPVNVVVANQMVSLCCKGCEKGLRKEPAKYVAMARGEQKQ